MTTPQARLNGRSMAYPRGFALGGSSSISKLLIILKFYHSSVITFLDFMAYTRGSSDDYDRLASTSGDPGWAWSNIFKYGLKASFLP